MWPPVTLIVAITVVLQIQHISAQLGNATLTAEDILDIYEPPPLPRGNSTRIVGGKPISIIRVPWQIVLYKNGNFICGGSIISSHWVLTAAHCVVSTGVFKVRAGSAYRTRGGQVRSVSRILVHGKYNANTMNDDIALIRVNEKFVWSSTVQPVRLARPARKLPARYFVSGWGTLRESGPTPVRLRGVTVKKVKRSVCQTKYAVRKIPITKHMICAASPKRDSCQGDSGGPLVFRRVQYGIVSFGIGCARTAYPGVYTNLRREFIWIRNKIRIHGGDLPTWV